MTKSSVVSSTASSQQQSSTFQQNRTPRVCDPLALSMALDALEVSSQDGGLPSLTKESLFLLNLNNEQEHLKPQNALVLANSNSDFTTTPELTMSSSSSLASFDEASKDRMQLQKIYNDSNSSIATMVQKFSSSNSTLDLQAAAKDSNAHVEHGNIGKEKDAKDFSTTSLSSLNSNIDTESTTTDVTLGKPRRLKSSLKLPGLHRSKSLPSAAKSVRFSAHLEVKTFSEHSKPSSISLDNSPESSPSGSDYDYEEEPKAFFDLKSSSYFNTSSDDSDSEEDYFSYKKKLRQSSWKLRATNYDFFNIHHRPQAVKLTSLAVRGTQLVGSVQVRNIHFEKYVEIKFSTDCWNSIYLVTASYARSVDSMTDQFNFEIDLNSTIMMNSKRMQRKNSSQPISVELCAKYVSNGQDIYYDNNGGQNYRFQLVSTLKKKQKLPRKHTKSSSYIDENFVSAKINSPPKVMTSGRYFSDDTDYFNTSADKYKYWQPTVKSVVSDPSTVCSTPFDKVSPSSFSASFAKTSHNATFKPMALPGYVSPKDSKENLKNNDSSYTDFLQKYCFFKSEAPKSNSHENVFIR